jgi:secondary thiamine-phosphate synthase enzyme
VTLRSRSDASASRRLSAISSVTPDLIATATLVVETQARGFTEITREAARFLVEAGGNDGALTLFLRHTSASLVIQENADPDVRIDLDRALDRLAPTDAGWVHDVEGPDDMPAHIKAMLTGVSLQVPVTAGSLALGTWQGIYLVEHRTASHRREIVLQFVGSRRQIRAGRHYEASEGRRSNPEFRRVALDCFACASQ